MLLLVLFAVVAGAGTALSPCVLPVLPALLSAGAAGPARGVARPVAIVVGLATTFTLTIAGAASAVDGTGLGDGTLRDVAVVVLLGFGVAVLVPAVGARIEAPLSRLARFGPSPSRVAGRGVGSGLLVGAALGLLYAPCAGPILAAVIAVSAASGRTVVVGAAYALGSAGVLLGLMLSGRGLLGRLRGSAAARAQSVLGGVMVVTAVAIALQLDLRLETAIAAHLPSAVVNPTGALERSAAVRDRLAGLGQGGGRGRFERADIDKAAGAPTPTRSGLPDLGPAPAFTGTQRWFNSAPLTLAALRGRVVLVDFWTYTCINCLRTLPYLKAWDAAYRAQGLTIVGVHSPEFSFEKDASNVQDAIRRSRIGYPVVQDDDLATWEAWGNEYWPAEYLVDAHGRVRYTAFGEGHDAATEAAIRGLLREAGTGRAGARAHPRGVVTPGQEATPETYLGTARAQGFAEGHAPLEGVRSYGTPPASLPPSTFALGGRWAGGPEALTAGPGAVLDARVQGRAVYVVLSPPDGASSGTVEATVDGRTRTLRVDGQRLYTLVQRRDTAVHELRLRFSPGVRGYSFTFG